MQSKKIPATSLLILGIVAASMLTALVCCYPKPVGPKGQDGEALTWPQMSLEQKKVHMQEVVLPKAGAVFREWRPERFQEIGCDLCHRPVEGEKPYQMPTAHLPRLSGAVLLGPEFDKHPDTTKLKLDRLVPAMGEALGVKTFSVITRKGFGCYSCHLGPTGPMFGN